MRQLIRSILKCCSLFALALYAFTTAAYAGAINCPTYNSANPAPSDMVAIVGVFLSPPAEPVVQSVNVSGSVANGAVLCTYTVQMTQNFTPSGSKILFTCPSYPLLLTMLEPYNPPMPGFTDWAFGPPGTPRANANSPDVSASQTVSAAFSTIKLPPPLHGSFTSCKVVNNGVFTFAIYSTIPSGYSCTTAGPNVTCNPPDPPINCTASLNGSNITTTWPTPPNPGDFAYYPPQSATYKNGVVNTQSPSLGTMASTVEANSKWSSLVLANGCSGAGAPVGVQYCIYHSLPWDNNTSIAYVAVATTGACSTQ
jgi:hypothetical protein